MTHADRLREEAKFIDETVRLHRRGWPESTLARFEQVAAALRAAADWCERVPHEEDCASLVGGVGAGGLECVPGDLDCDCLLSEQAP